MVSGRVAFGLLSCLCLARVAVAAEFFNEVERDFPLRSIGQLQVTNLRGGISIQGWAQDRVRVKAKQRAIADTQEGAAKLFSAADFRFRGIGGDIELSAEYGKGLNIEQRLQERNHPRTSMEMVVLAPANLTLRVWATDGKVSVKSWNAAVEVRTTGGPILIDNVRSGGVSVLCPDCAISAHDIHGPIRCMGGTSEIDLSDISGDQIYTETTSGNQKISRITGDQLYVSKAGAITGSRLNGRIEFHSQRGKIGISESSGMVSGRTDLSDIDVRMDQWKFADRAIIESIKGNISLSLPRVIAADVDFFSVHGKLHVDFPVQPMEMVYGPQPANQLKGQIGLGGEQLSVSSFNGNVDVRKGN